METIKVAKKRHINAENHKFLNSEIKDPSSKKRKLEWVRNPAIFAAVLEVYDRKALLAKVKESQGHSKMVEVTNDNLLTVGHKRAEKVSSRSKMM